MAEKEERILITQWNIKDDICPVPADSQCYTTKSCDDCKVGMSRQEAIEKMAKAVCMRSMYGCKRCVFGKDKEKCEEWIAFNHIRDAEAALNALLSEGE